MAEKGDSSDEEPTIAEDVVVTKYKMAGDMANRECVLIRIASIRIFILQYYVNKLSHILDMLHSTYQHIIYYFPQSLLHYFLFI